MARMKRGERSSTWTWAIVATLVAVAFAGGLFAAFWPRAAEPTPISQSTAPSFTGPETPDNTQGTSTPTSNGSEQPTACPRLSSDTSFPVEAPVTKWETHPSGMYLPVSSEFGPAKRDTEFWQCFAHSSKGAIYAGMSLTASFASLEPRDIDAALPGPNRQKIFDEQLSIRAEKSGSASPKLPIITGYRVLSSSAKQATVDYLTPLDERSFYIRVDLAWDPEAGDWRLDLTQGMPTWKVAPDPSAFTVWK